MSRHALGITLIALAFLSVVPPAAAKTAHPAAYRLLALKGDTFTAPTIIESDFDGDYGKVAYVPAAISDQSAEALQAAIPPAPEQELTFEHGGKTLKYVAVGDLSKPANAIIVYVHGFGDDRTQGINEKRFGGNLGRLKRLVAENGAIYLSPDFSGFGGAAADQITALMADYAGRAPGAPIFVACVSYGGGLCWRLAEDADPSSALRGVLIFGAPVDKGFLKRIPLSRPHIYLGIGTKDAFASWKSAAGFFRDIKVAVPDYPIKLTVFDSGEHATAIRLTDWVAVFNWMLAGSDIREKPIAPTAALPPPCPRPRPTADGSGPSSYCARP